MSKPMPPLSALRAFEAAARHLSLTRAAVELHVTPAALSHQIRGLEQLLGLTLFERRPRGIELTDAGRALYPGLHSGFGQIRQAVAALELVTNDRVLVISAPPGFTAKWLVPRLYRFVAAEPEIDARISATLEFANFTTDGVDAAIRNLQIGGHQDPDLVVELLFVLRMVPVCSPRFASEHGLRKPVDLLRMPLIHDESLSGRAALPSWSQWLAAAGIEGVDMSRGLRFNSADHAIEATVEGAGVLLAHHVLAMDDLRTGRLIAPFDLALDTGRGFHFVCPKGNERRPKVRAFRDWLRSERDRAIEASPVAAMGIPRDPIGHEDDAAPEMPQPMPAPQPAKQPRSSAKARPQRR
jgi:LysR family glycine cleavage system transcriptional activator